MPLDVRHGPGKGSPACLIFPYDKAVYSDYFEKDTAWYTHAPSHARQTQVRNRLVTEPTLAKAWVGPVTFALNSRIDVRRCGRPKHNGSRLSKQRCPCPDL